MQGPENASFRRKMKKKLQGQKLREEIAAGSLLPRDSSDGVIAAWKSCRLELRLKVGFKFTYPTLDRKSQPSKYGKYSCLATLSSSILTTSMHSVTNGSNNRRRRRRNHLRVPVMPRIPIYAQQWVLGKYNAKAAAPQQKASHRMR